MAKRARRNIQLRIQYILLSGKYYMYVSARQEYHSPSYIGGGASDNSQAMVRCWALNDSTSSVNC